MKVSVKHLVGLGALLLGLAFAPAARASEEAVDKLLPSTAWVLAKLPKLPDDQFSQGSGVLIDKDRRWVITNYHVVQDSKKIVVFFPDVRDGELMTDREHYFKNGATLAIKARPVVIDKKRDLAILELDRLPSSAKAVKLAAAEPRAGQTIHHIGSPVNATALWVYCKGSVRTVHNKKFPMGGLGLKFILEARVVEAQMPIDPGDSGGPVVNDKGELVSVVQGFLPSMKDLTICISVKEIREVVQKAASNPDVLVERRPGKTPKAPKTPPPPSKSLAGTWRGSVTNPKGAELTFKLTVGADDQATLTLDAGMGKRETLAGTLAHSGDELSLVVDGRTEPLGRLTWLDADSFLLENGQLSVTLRRQR